MDKHGNVSQLFNKKFEFKPFHKVPQKVFESPQWNIPILQQKKIELNNIKAQLGKYNLTEWSRHTKHNDPSSFIIRFLKQNIEPELVTQAWCKFYEILNHFSVIPNIKQMENVSKYTTLHLCEAPGAFISALNHYIRSHYDYFDWDWIATTLNPDYEGNKVSQMIPDDRLYRFTKEKWCFGMDGTGDATKYYNYIYLVKHVEPKVWLVTADGSIDCMLDPGSQESLVEYLVYCEVITALSVLLEQGTFIVKIFTIFESSTICILYLLNILFESINAFKPCTSKSGNSEMYIICTGFKGLNSIHHLWDTLLKPYQNGEFNKDFCMFNLNEIPKLFLKDIELCADFFMNLQIETITNNIETFRKRDSLHLSLVHHTKVRVANMFLKKYRVKKIPPTYKILPFTDLTTNHFRMIENCQIQLISQYKTCKFMNDNIENIISIKYGKKIEKLGFSRFCELTDYNCLNVFRKGFQDHYSLYNLVYIYLSDDYLILNRNDFDCYSYSNFQHEFFNFFVCHKLSKNLIILDIPLVTNFLVGILYFLCSVYTRMSVHLSGSIVFSQLKPEMVHKFEYFIHTVKDSYENLPQNFPFEVDIVEIIPSNLILYNEYYQMIYNYNNALLDKLKFRN